MVNNSTSLVTTWMLFQGPGFTLKSPSDWFITAAPTIQVMFVAPYSGEKIRGNLAISLQPVQEDVTSVSVAEIAKETQQRDYPQFEVVAEVAIQVDTLEGIYRLYTWYNPQEALFVTQLQTFFVVNQMLITLTGTCSQKQEAEFLPSFNEMIDSFRIP
jgi:hypothetical protein